VPIQIQWEEQQARPAVVCDQCVERIADVSQGLAMWEERDITAVGRRELFVVHRECRRDFERFRLSCTAGSWMAQDLAWFLLHLGAGVEFRAEEHAAAATHRVTI
jgi:hypothetical protein